MISSAEAVVVERPGQQLDLVVLREFQAEEIHARHPHAAVAAGEVVELEQERVEQHAERERQHAEEDADIAHAEQARSAARSRHGGEHDQRPARARTT